MICIIFLFGFVVKRLMNKVFSIFNYNDYFEIKYNVMKVKI